MIGSACENFRFRKDFASSSTIERKLEVSERSACMWREIYGPVIWREFKASCWVNCEEHLRPTPVKDLALFGPRDERVNVARNVNKIRTHGQKFCEFSSTSFVRESCGNLLLSERVLTYRARRIAPPTIGEGRKERRTGVVKERADKSRRKERINRARPLSTYLSAIREHPSLPT